jgi:capsular exopolysaccharide synthesis family protein
MSKIYEALLRAEMDRIAQQNRAENDHETTGLPELTPEQHAEAAIDVAAAASLPLPATFLARRETWRPDELRLPALQRRGFPVEQIRDLRSKLNHLRLDMPLKTLLISSGQAGEGKSFVAANLAISLASHRGARVLLIDGDMRRGTLHNLLGTVAKPGLTEYLGRSASLDEIIQQGTPQSIGNSKGLMSLSFIACGEDAENAADLSVNGYFEKLLASLKDHFDWIVVDSPPVNLVADGVNLAVACDGVILVTRATVTKYEVAQRALVQLKSTKVLGVVLNAATDAAPIGGYYGYDR